MKKLLLLLSLVTPGLAFALPISYEPFDYALSNSVTSTNLIGNTSPDGLTWDLAGGGTSNPITNQPSISPG
ncbi:MAG TPA: hypothetical protein VHH88_10475, partial [Verrucomicrobiae bacterium]|nr:hypothetical protein [Verrucomicrobiae bacterium]